MAESGDGARIRARLPDVELARALVEGARRIVAFTGAGLSTPSGIPDFRSADTGLWERDDPYVVASLGQFRQDPRPFFRWIRPLARLSSAALPNPGHIALVALENEGKLTSVITQNIDGLHQAAGSARVHEVHGSLRTATCQSCQARTDGLVALACSDIVPRCQCGGVLKPDIVFFEEMLPITVLEAGEADLRACDLVIVAGSSLEVMPAGRMPLIATRHGARMIIVNRDPTPLDSRADVVLRGDVAELLPMLAGLTGG